MSTNNSSTNSKRPSFLLTARSDRTSSQRFICLEIGFGASFLRDRAITDAVAADITTTLTTTAATTAGPRVIIPGPPAPPSNDGRAPGTDPPLPLQVQRFFQAMDEAPLQREKAALRKRLCVLEQQAAVERRLLAALETAERRIGAGEDPEVVRDDWNELEQ